MARLPTPGGDSGNWGDILNEYLSQSLDSNGLLRAESVGGDHIQNNSITSEKLADGAVNKNSVGLGDVDNTSDADKPISTAAQTVLDSKITGPTTANSEALVRFDGTGGKLVKNSTVYVSDAGHVGLSTASPTHSLTFGSASNGISLYSTADQTMNYERLRMNWNGTHFTITTDYAGSGMNRPLRLNGGGSQLTLSATSVASELRRDNTSLDLFRITSSGMLRAAGSQAAVVIDPTISQSGSANYTALLVNPNESSVGSGAKLLADFQSGGNSKVTIDNSGKFTWQGDTNLYRNQAGQLKTDYILVGDGGVYAGQGSGGAKIGMNSAGGLEFGPGSGARDTFITRTAAGKVNIGNELIVNNKQVLTASGWHFMGNSTPPAGPPAGGGYLFVEAGALKYIGSSGTITTIAPA